MLFNSISFIIFLPIVFTFYWLINKKPVCYQNLLLLVASYVFYAFWDYRFLSLIIISSLIDYFIGLELKVATKQKIRQLLLVVSLIVNLGLLAIFKYYNFFIESWVDAWKYFGINMQISTLKLILPVGISFYTFQTLSYTIDVYKKQLEPTTNLLQFAAFVSFFPQLVAGPIERAKHLLPQFEAKRVFNSDFAISGFYLIVWGLFKKVVVADNCAFFVNQIFEGSLNYSSLELFLGALLFGIQIYGDFSGYSDIAIGVARLFGFSLMINFSFPYFSRNIAEFWRRWHISLSTWFRDYLYIPLGGSRGSSFVKIRNVFLVFLISGLWHGANWTFIAWGCIHALLFLPLLIAKRNRVYLINTKVSFRELPQLFWTFILVTLAWIFFRADSIDIAYEFLIDIVSFKGASISTFYKNSKSLLFSLIIILSVIILFLFELFAVQHNQKEVKLNRVTVVLISLVIIFMGVFKNPSDFIYFQF